MIVCPWCKIIVDKAAGVVNRSRALGMLVYCGRICAGLARRKDKSDEEKVRAKADYDLLYRERNKEMLRKKKAAYYAANFDRDKERETRQKRMPHHIEYCRRPEYRAQKAVYDQRRRAEIHYGPYADAAIILLKVQEEINDRSTWLERQAAKGTLTKAQQRKRDYGKRSIQETVRSHPQECAVGHASEHSERLPSTRRG